MKQSSLFLPIVLIIFGAVWFLSSTDILPTTATLLALALVLGGLALLLLDGWEVKAVRAGRVQLKESYIHWKKDAFYLVGCHITALPTASTHVKPDPVRQRKLLLKQSEINKLIGKVERSGYTLVPLNLHYRRGYIKMDIGLAKGKKQHDKRQSMKEADWKREKQRLLKNR